jgi:hypothetical protein
MSFEDAVISIPYKFDRFSASENQGRCVMLEQASACSRPGHAKTKLPFRQFQKKRAPKARKFSGRR